MSLISNERTKLTANVLDPTAAGVFITGVIAPVVAAFYGVPGPSQAGIGAVLLSAGVGLYYLTGWLDGREARG